MHTCAVACSVVAVGMITSGPVFGQAYPVKPIRLIVPSTPGSPPDIRARWLAEKLTTALGQTVIVDNRPGAAGNIATTVAARSAPDGYTLLFVHQGTLAINPHVYARPGYDPVADFAPLTRVVVSPMLLAVHPAVAANSAADLIRLARERPG